MSNPPDRAKAYRQILGDQAPGRASILLRPGGIGTVLAVTCGGFAYMGGWLSPGRLPAIAPQNPALCAVLRAARTWLAYLLFLTVLLHLAAALFHALIRRDSVFRSMAP